MRLKIVNITIVSFFFVPLLVSFLSCTVSKTKSEQSLSEVKQMWDLSKNDDGKYVILFSNHDKNREGYLIENENHKLPVLLLFIREGDIEHSLIPSDEGGYTLLMPPPRVYMAIWEDGLIVWGATRDSELFAEDIENGDQGTFLLSSIGSNKVKKLVDVLIGSSIWEDRLPVRIGGSHTCLTIRSDVETYTTYADRVAVLRDRDSEFGNRVKKEAREWERITKEIFDMIPKEGISVNISFKRYDSTPHQFGWVGIVE
jgi:hypothetical protein